MTPPPTRGTPLAARLRAAARVALRFALAAAVAACAGARADEVPVAVAANFAGPLARIAEGFAAACAQGRALGFDGKTLIHPSQVEPCNAAFAPSESEVADARKIIAAFDLPENRAKGAISLDGRMVERLHAEIAAKVVAMSDAIAARAA
jgi:citrate lyase beta subunit